MSLNGINAQDWSNTTGSTPEIVNNGAGSTTNTVTGATIDGVQGAADESTTNFDLTGTGTTISTTGSGIVSTSSNSVAITTASGTTINANNGGVFSANYGIYAIDTSTANTITVINGSAISANGFYFPGPAFPGNFPGVYFAASIYAQSAGGAIVITNGGALTTANAIGQGTGIYAENDGAGTVQIDNTSTALLKQGSEGGTVNGISAVVNNGDLYITNAGSIGAYLSIGGKSEGTGNIYITNNGSLSGFYGIYAESTGTGNISLTNTGVIDGSYFSIQAQSAQGSIFITNGGTMITVSGSTALSAENDGTTTGIAVTNTGSIGGGIGVEAWLTNAANASTLSLSNAGTITAQGSGNGAIGLSAISAGTGSAIVVSNAGTITASDTGSSSNSYGIYALGANGPVTLTNHGLVSIDTSGNGYGLYASNADTGVITLLNDAHGNISVLADNNSYGMAAVAQNDAINLTNNGTVTAASDPTGSSYGLFASNAGSGTMTILNGATGAININSSASANAYGVYAVSANGLINLTNSGTINANNIGNGGNSDGLYVENDNTGAITILNGVNGNISVQADGTVNGIQATASNDAINLTNQGTISAYSDSNGYGYGVLAANGTTGNITISNSGSINAESLLDTYGISSSLQTGTNYVSNGGAITVTNDGDGYAYGIFAVATTTGPVTVLNDTNGTINVQSADASGDVTYGIYAQLAADSGDAIHVTNNGGMAVTNSGGDITYGIYAEDDGTNATTLLNSATGTITVSSTNTEDAYGMAADATANGSVQITNSGTVMVTAAGSGSGGGPIRPIGPLAGNGYGLYAENDNVGNLTVLNAAGGVIGVEAQSIAYGIDANVQTGVINLTNNGSVTSASTGGDSEYGLYAESYESGAMTLLNGATGSVTIDASTGGTAYGLYALSADDQVNVTNSGSIAINTVGSGADSYGAYAENDDTGAITLLNAATGNISVQADGAAYGLAASAYADAINLTNGGTVTVVAGGSGYGVWATNGNSGAITILNAASGTINVQGSTAATGIYAENAGNSGDISLLNSGTLIATCITGVAIGMEAVNDGAGAVVVSNNGVIDLTAGTAFDTSYGIKAVSEGGAITVSNSGTLNLYATGGAPIVGIGAYQMSATGSGAVVVTNSGLISYPYSNVVYPYQYYPHLFIDAENDGLGAVSVYNFGSMVFDPLGSESGIYASINNTASMAAVTVTNTGNIGNTYNSTIAYGIEAVNAGLGAVTVSNSGAITLVTVRGIYAENNNAAATGAVIITNTGYIGGGPYPLGDLFAQNNGSGGVTVLNQGGTLSANNGYGNGITVNNTVGTGSLVITNSGEIYSGYNSGVYLSNADASATTSIVNSGEILASGTGIQVESAGNTFITNQASGTIETNSSFSPGSGTAVAVEVAESGTGSVTVSNAGLINFGSISGAAIGIEATSSGTGSISVTTTNLTVTSSNGSTGNTSSATAVELVQSSTGNANPLAFTNTATFTLTETNGTAAGYGVYASNAGSGGISLLNTGTLTGTNFSTLTTTNGSLSGLYASNSGSGPVTVSNSGTIIAQASDAPAYGIDVASSGSGAVTLLNGGAIGTAANPISGSGAYNTEGSAGIYVDNANSTVTVSNQAGASIVVSLPTGSVVPYGIFVVSNDSAAGSQGVSVYNAGSIAVTGYGPYGVSAQGILARDAGSHGVSVTNAGSVGVNPLGGNVFGGVIVASDSGTGSVSVLNTSGATLTATDGNIVYGINAGANSGSLTVSNAGTISLTSISDVGEGIYASDNDNNSTGAVAVTNSGTILSGGGGEYGINLAAGTGAIDLVNSGVIGTAAAPIAGNDNQGGNGYGSQGIYASGDAAITASNSATGSIYVLDNGSSTAAYGIDLLTGDTASGGAIQATNAGTISALGSGGGAYGIQALNTNTSGTDLVNVLNTGTLIASDTNGGEATAIDAENAGTGAVTVVTTNLAVVSSNGAAGNTSSATAVKLVQSSAGNANQLAFTNTGTFTLTETNGTAAGYGVYASNAGSGGISLLNTGTITGTNVSSIATTSGSLSGLYASNSGSGPVTVSNTGTIASVNTTTDSSSIGAAYGIYATSTGTGAITLFNSGSITTGGNGGAALYAAGNAAITVDNQQALSVSGSAGSTATSYGIDVTTADTTGTGTISLTNTAVIGITDAGAGGAVGIRAANTNTASTSAVVVSNSGNISAVESGAGAAAGMSLTNMGTGALTITNGGSIVDSGTGAIGIAAYANGVVTLDNTGAINSTGTGAYGIYVASPETATITSGAPITINGTNTYGIYVSGTNAVTITNTGVIVAQDPGGESFGIDSQTTGAGGIAVDNTNSITALGGGSGATGIRAVDENTGATDAVAVTNSGPLTVSDTNGGAAIGIDVENDGTGAVSLQNTANLVVTSAGSGGALGATGIRLVQADASNPNTLSFTNQNAITVVETNVAGDGYGIEALNAGSSAVTLVNDAAIAATNATSIGGGALTGILATNGTGSVTVSNAGSIDAVEQTSNSTLNASATGIAAQSAGGLIAVTNSQAVAAVASGSGSATAISATASGSASVSITNGASLSASVSGSGAATGLSVQSTASGAVDVGNSQSISASATAGAAAALSIEAASAVTVNNSGSLGTSGAAISGNGSAGIAAQGAGPLAVTNSGTIFAGNVSGSTQNALGIEAENTGSGATSVSNTAPVTVTGTGGGATALKTGSSLGEALVQVANSGNLAADDTSAAAVSVYGIDAANGAAGGVEVTNGGTITVGHAGAPGGGNVYGISARTVSGAINILNQSTLNVIGRGGNVYGLYGASSSGGTVTLSNAASINLSGSGALYGLYGSSTGVVNIVDSGNINATGGTAIAGAGAQNSAINVTLTGDPVINGVINGNASLTGNQQAAASYLHLDLTVPSNESAQLAAAEAYLAANPNSGQFTIGGVTYTYENFTGTTVSPVTPPTGNLGNNPQVQTLVNTLNRNVLTDITFEGALLDSRLENVRSGLTGGLDWSGMSLVDADNPLLSQISGQLYAFNPTLEMEQETMSDTPDQVGGEDPLLNRWGAFATGNAILASQGATSSQASVDSTTVDFNFGTDYKINKEWTVGFLAGYGQTTADLDSYGSRLNVSDYRIGPYAGYSSGDWYVNGHAYYGLNIGTSTRAIDNGAGAPADGKPDGDQYGTAFDTGYKFHAGNLTYGPTLGLQYTHLDIDSYEETGAGANDLLVGDQKVDSLIASLGGRVSYDFHTSWHRLTFRPELDAAWQHECLDTSETIGEAFVTSGSGSFVVNASGLPRDAAVVGAGLSAILNSGSLLFLRYDAQIGQADYSAQSITGGLRIVF